MIFSKGHTYKSLLYFKTGEKPALTMTSCGMISTFFCFFVFSIQPAANHSIHLNRSSRNQHCNFNLLLWNGWRLKHFSVFGVCFFLNFFVWRIQNSSDPDCDNLSSQGKLLFACSFFFFYLHMSIHFYGRHGLKLQYSARR